MAKTLGYPSIEAMLDSEEFNDIINVDYRVNTLGAKPNDIPILCYNVSFTIV